MVGALVQAVHRLIFCNYISIINYFSTNFVRDSIAIDDTYSR